MAGDDAPTTELRHEHKLATSEDRHGVVARLLTDRACVVEEHPARGVHSVYLDGVDLALLRQGFDGLARRRKVRVRWYGDDGARAGPARLEVKSRVGGLSKKEVVGLGVITLAELLDDDARRARLAPFEGLLGLAPASLGPVLHGHYRRRYLRLAGSSVRVTVDDELRFKRPSAERAFPVHTRGTIIEVKHAALAVDDARALVAELPWRLTRHSKYGRGMQLLGF